MINNIINFLGLKIKINTKNKLKFDFYDIRTDFPFRENIFTHHNSFLHKYVYKYIYLIAYTEYFILTYKNKNINIKFKSKHRLCGYPN